MNIITGRSFKKTLPCKRCSWAVTLNTKHSNVYTRVKWKSASIETGMATWCFAFLKRSSSNGFVVWSRVWSLTFFISLLFQPVQKRPFQNHDFRSVTLEATLQIRKLRNVTSEILMQENNLRNVFFFGKELPQSHYSPYKYLKRNKSHFCLTHKREIAFINLS